MCVCAISFNMMTLWCVQFSTWKTFLHVPLAHTLAMITANMLLSPSLSRFSNNEKFLKKRAHEFTFYWSNAVPQIQSEFAWNWLILANNIINNHIYIIIAVVYTHFCCCCSILETFDDAMWFPTHVLAAINKNTNKSRFEWLVGIESRFLRKSNKQ